MALIKSISGIRGTIGGKPGENLTPVDLVKYTAAFAAMIKGKNKTAKIVVGRDGRISGAITQSIVVNTLLSMGIHVIDAGLSTTPTVELAVKWESADGGIIITASHNPKEWNALKLLNSDGEFISAEDGEIVLKTADAADFMFVPVDKLGVLEEVKDFMSRHIDAVINYPLTEVELIRSRKFRVVVDTINSTGALIIPELLKRLGVEEVILLN
ncbi:MAG: phosphoglucosamine mutase, partial [Chitinophagaceae bacterium]